MTLNVSADLLQQELDRGLVLIATRTYPADGDRPAFQRFDLADPTHTCLRPMRGWKSSHPAVTAYGSHHPAKATEQHGFCTLEKGHLGRHTTVTFGCDCCGRVRRGEPYTHGGPEGDIAVCFFCATESRRNAERGIY